MPKVFMPSAAGSTQDCHLAPVPCTLSGGVAQLGERLPCTQDVIGSIPFTSTISGGMCQETGARKSVVLCRVVTSRFWSGWRVDELV